MAQAATNPKIEELRGRLKADPKSRLFYPLAEELRKINQCDEAEQVLRAGLSSHPTYLSAWVSLGRVLRDLKKNQDAVEALQKALLLDPGNVVAARLLGDAYLDLGEKVEAIKKYKLVFALLPSDDSLEGVIEKLDAEINAPAIIPEPDAPFELTGGGRPSMDSPAPHSDDERVFDETGSSILQQHRTMDLGTGDAEPMHVSHEESPFQDPGVIEGYGSDAFSIEQPQGMHLTEPPSQSESEEASGSGLAPGIVTNDYAVTSSMSPIDDDDDFGRIIRMADLFAAEGSFAEARDIYEDLIARDPNNATIRAKLEALPSATPPSPAMSPEPQPPVLTGSSSAGSPGAGRNPKVDKLESWLARMKRV